MLIKPMKSLYCLGPELGVLRSSPQLRTTVPDPAQSGSSEVALAPLEKELEADEVVPVPGFTTTSRYGFVHLQTRSISPAAQAFIDEIRAVEAEFVARDERLAVRYGAS